MSGIVNRIREGVHEATRPKDHNVTTTGNGVPEGTVGPHNTRVANAADPRVDSDLDGRGATHHNHHHHHGGPGQISPGNDNFGAAGNTRNTNVGSTNAGPHDSNIANKLDPRVDSDLDGSRNAGLNRTTNPSGNTFSATGTATGSTNAGPHDSNIANKLDPRVDSDLDGSRNAGMNQTTNMSGRPVGAGAGMGSTNAGPHNSNIANKLDPRVDSDLDGSRNVGMNQTTTASGRPMTNNATAGSTFTTGTTSGSTNAGPHKSNLMNKLDPRVDSDLDGSSNMGMNQTTRPHY